MDHLLKVASLSCFSQTAAALCITVTCNVNYNKNKNKVSISETKNQHEAQRWLIWPKRAINKILFSQFVNKPQEVRGQLPQHLKHLILAQSSKTCGPPEIL